MCIRDRLYEEYGENTGDVVILGVALPNVGKEGSQEEIAAFLEENGYTCLLYTSRCV